MTKLKRVEQSGCCQDLREEMGVGVSVTRKGQQETSS